MSARHHDEIPMFYQGCSGHGRAEASLIAKLSAACVTLDEVQRAIVGETYTRLPSGKVMICELTIDNGFTVRGESCVVNAANFDELTARKKSREAASAKVWELLGFRLQEQIFSERDALPLS